MDLTTTSSWPWTSPWLLGAVAVWVVGWLIFEWLWYRANPRPYSVVEVKRSLMTFCVVGLAQVAISLLLAPVLFLVAPFRVMTLDMGSWWHWALAWVITDFAYYWIHRFLHATRIGWSLHAPHHSIRQVTLLDSLRTSWGEQPMGVFAYGIPLVLLGVPPLVAAGFYALVALYQFCVHTEASWSLGPLDAVIYTPAAHRLHHSTERAEADMNFGGFFLLFDRLFGTHVPTTRTYRPAQYGLPDEQPDSVSGILFGEMKRFARGLGAVRGIAARLRHALTRP